jgi:hypothetical protein
MHFLPSSISTRIAACCIGHHHLGLHPYSIPMGSEDPQFVSTQMNILFSVWREPTIDHAHSKHGALQD